ncbi:MAG: HlyC/CorC family transporter [Magnetospirillum gryphiswaldense]|nr:HlyC/CorC family transporter [Magnetospirillum gryphiswaldense]
MSLAFEIAVIAFLVLLNGAFAMSEMAIVSSRKARLAMRAAEGSKGAQAAMSLAENPGRFLSSVQIGITLVGILAGAYSGATLAVPFEAWLNRFPVLDPVAEVLSIAVVVGAITYASLIIGELVPKQIALGDPERVAIVVARPMALVARFASPLVWLLEHSSRMTLAVLRIRPAADQSVTEEEVKAMIAEGTQSGVFEPQEQELLSGVMRFGDRRIRGIMTPRNEMVSIDLDWDQDRIIQVMKDSPHSRLPVYRGNSDNILGVVQAKDLLNIFLSGQELRLEDAVKPVQVVHDNSPALMVLDTLKDSLIHMALVVDEYGSVEGIVTAADILSAILGGLSEHGVDYEGAIVARQDGSWLVDGSVAVDVARDRLNCRVLVDEDSDYDTMAGFILSKSRAIPSAGDHFTWQGWRFEVVDMDGRRIDKVLVSRQDEEGG